MNNQPEPLKKIKSLLRLHRNGLTITDIAEKLRLNRNSAAKYLEILLISGDVKLNTFGPAKVYTYSQKMPVSAMLKLSRDLMLLIDGDLHVLDANENAIGLLGVSREDLIGQRVDEVPSPLIARLDIPRIFDEVQATGEIQRDFCLTLNGEDRHFRMRLIPTVFDSMNEGLTVIGEDVTEQIRFEERLMVSEARFRAIVEDQTDFICRYKPDGTISFVNEPMSRYLGLTLEEVSGKNVLSFIHSEDHAAAREILAAIALKRQTRSGEFRFMDRDGRVRWYQWSTRGIYDSRGVLVECQSVGRDITTEQEQAIRLRESEERFHMITDHSPFPITIMDPSGRFLYANAAFTCVFGYTLEDIPTGDDWFRLAFPRSNERLAVMHFWNPEPSGLNLPDLDPLVFPVTCRDGIVRQIRFFLFALPGGERVVVYEDLTQKQEAERLHTMLASIVNTSTDAPSLYRSLHQAFPLPPKAYPPIGHASGLPRR